MYSPFACRIPLLRAAHAPALSCIIYLIRESPNAATTDSVPSVEPSSTTITSKSLNVCSRTLLMESPIVSARLKVGMTTLTLGIGTPSMSKTH